MHKEDAVQSDASEKTILNLVVWISGMLCLTFFRVHSMKWQLEAVSRN